MIKILIIVEAGINHNGDIKKDFYYNEYFKKESSEKILKILENIITKNLIKKPFFENFKI